MPFVEERGVVRYARRLLHIVRDDCNSVFARQLGNEVLDSRSRLRVERTARLVHKQNFWLYREGAGNAKPLLLSARHSQRVRAKPVFHLVPKGGAAQGGFDDSVKLALRHSAFEAHAVGYVVVNALRERIRTLEDHADAPPKLGDVETLVVDVYAVERKKPRRAAAVHEVVHAVYAAQKGALSATARPDYRRHLAALEFDVHVFDRVEFSVVDGEISGGYGEVAPFGGFGWNFYAVFHFCFFFVVCLRHDFILLLMRALTHIATPLRSRTIDMSVSTIPYWTCATRSAISCSEQIL